MADPKNDPPVTRHEFNDLWAQLLAVETMFRCFMLAAALPSVAAIDVPRLALVDAETILKNNADTQQTPLADIQTTRALQIVARYKQIFHVDGR